MLNVRNIFGKHTVGSFPVSIKPEITDLINLLLKIIINTRQKYNVNKCLYIFNTAEKIDMFTKL